jgi:hypothetical protein
MSTAARIVKRAHRKYKIRGGPFGPVGFCKERVAEGDPNTVTVKACKEWLETRARGVL